MLFQVFLFTLGLGALYLGADWLIRGATSLAFRFGLRRMVVGLTVVALGTSMPEFLVNVIAALWGDHGLALGNIVGSNIANIALILGMSALIYPLAVRPLTLRKEYPLMMIVLAAFYAMAWDGRIGRLDGLLLVIGLIGFMVYVVVDARTEASRTAALEERAEAENGPQPVEILPMWKKLMYLSGGVLALSLGARLMVMAAINIAEALQINHVVIGLTVVAIGTSLPELAASVISAVRREPDLSVGNILGSNLLNVLFVVGLVAVIRPLSVEPEALSIHFPVMMAFGLVLLPIAWTGYRISRLEGLVLLAGFAGYMAYLALPYL